MVRCQWKRSAQAPRSGAAHGRFVLFSEHIKKVVDNVEGGIGGVIMGLDGIAVDLPVNGHNPERIELLGQIANKILR